MKKFDIKDVFSWSNTEQAEAYIGKDCYFADSLDDLENQVKKDQSYKLQRVSQLERVHSVFLAEDELWELCLPVDKVIEIKEKKYRPFRDLEEFNKVIPMGSVFKFRYKDSELVHSIYYYANVTNENGFQAIYFESYFRGLKQCFEDMELFLDNKWQPFGVMQND